MHRGLILLLFIVLVFKASKAQNEDSTIIFSTLQKFSTNPFYQLSLLPNSPSMLKAQIKLQCIRQISDHKFIIDQLHLSRLSTLKNWFTVNTPSDNCWKLSKTIQYLKTNGNVQLQYKFYLQVDDTSAVLAIDPQTNTVVKKIGDSYFVLIKNRLKEIEQLYLNNQHVQLIDVITSKPTVELGVPGFDLTANKINLVHNEFPAINGNNLHVSIKEDFFDTTDIDILGRTVYSPLASASISNHANFMATIIAGAGNSVDYAKGVAEAANVSSSSFDPILPDADSYYQQQNITVQNHSYGAAIDNDYGLNAVAFDKSSNDNPNLLHVFSSGNSGNMLSTNGKYANVEGYANLTGNFKMAKNILLVGAVDSFGNAVALSSAGPAYDGRIKPEITAFQQNGTSESAALVSGTCLLLQQYYQTVNQKPLPSALAKAILVNSADDIGVPGPDYKTGFGNLNAYQAMQTIRQQHIISGTFTTSNPQTFSLTIPPNAVSLKVTLCWNDTVAALNANTALINDLDLDVKDNINHTVWLPWVLSSFPLADSLQLPAVRRRDSINNIEQVSINTISPGDYKINIMPYNLTTGHQDFYIAYSFDTANYFKWERPARQDFAEAGKATLLRWNTNFKGTAKIEYSLNDNNWKPLAAAVPLGDKQLYITAPDTLSKAQLRISFDGTYFYSDTFLITTLAQPTTGFICGDSLLIYWKKLKGATGYQLYSMGDKYLEPLASTTDTAIIINKNLLKQSFIAVAPIIQNAPAIKSYAFDYTKQGAGCYINSFYATNNGSTAVLNLTVGTLINVSSIAFEKAINNTFVSVITLPVTTSMDYRANYPTLSSGKNLFRAKITLVTGQVIYSNPEAVLYAAPGEYVLFPTPVVRGNIITIISAAPDGEQLLITDATGRIIVQKRITAVQDYINTSAYEAGIYFYQVIKNNQRFASGKLIILQ